MKKSVKFNRFSMTHIHFHITYDIVSSFIYLNSIRVNFRANVVRIKKYCCVSKDFICKIAFNEASTLFTLNICVICDLCCQMQMFSMNIIICCHRTHSWSLKQRQMQTLSVNKASSSDLNLPEIFNCKLMYNIETRFDFIPPWSCHSRMYY